jgi:hypothetical protein
LEQSEFQTKKKSIGAQGGSGNLNGSKLNERAGTGLGGSSSNPSTMKGATRNKAQIQQTPQCNSTPSSNLIPLGYDKKLYDYCYESISKESSKIIKIMNLQDERSANFMKVVVGVIKVFHEDNYGE